MIPILPSTAWREFRGLPAKRSSNLAVHLASVAGPDGRVHRCFVKPAAVDSPTVLVESIAWLLAGAVGLPRPGFAAILMVPTSPLRSNVKLDPSWDGCNECVAFCSEAVNGEDLSQVWVTGRWLARANTLKIKHMPALAGFDEWIDNADRHGGNILTTGKAVIPIDNEYALYDEIWRKRYPTRGAVQRQSILDAARALLHHKALHRFQTDACLASREHQHGLASVKAAVVQTVDALVHDRAEAASISNDICAYLDGRAHGAWLPNRLGVIV